MRDEPPLARASAVDSSVIIAGLLPWHQHHEAARPVLVALFGPEIEEGQGGILPLPALVESYSVLTRLPSPHRLSPSDAFRALHGAMHRRASLGELHHEAAWEFLERLQQGDVTGGTVYDAVILEAALAAGAHRLFTLNARHFRRLARREITIVDPSVSLTDAP